MKFCPLVHEISWVQGGDLKIEVKVTKIKSVLKLVPMLYPFKFGDIPPIGSRDIVDTVKISHI